MGQPVNLCLKAARLTFAGFALLLLAIPAGGQTLTLGGGEIRHGEFARQDFGGLEASYPVGSLRAYVSAYSRHGGHDDDNSALPWITTGLAVPVWHVGGFVGLQGTPMDYGRPTVVLGPRIDYPLGDRWRLHFSHYWRGRGYVGMRMTRWTAETSFRLDLELL